MNSIKTVGLSKKFMQGDEAVLVEDINISIAQANLLPSLVPRVQVKQLCYSK